MGQLKLFAVYLGGRAPKANTELHDVVFVVGRTIEDTYEQLLDQWFGSPEGLHLDSWLELDVVDGWRVSLSETPSAGSEKLFFVNLGAYDHRFTELHATAFYVAGNATEAKARAKAELLAGANTAHKDDLHEIDDCIAVGMVNRRHVTLTKTGEAPSAKPNDGYHIVPRPAVEAYRKRFPTPPQTV
jgi:hypothetical protein